MKYHITKDGRVAPCKASRGRCPFGGESAHFSTEGEAQRFLESEYSGSLFLDRDVLTQEQQSLLSVVSRRKPKGNNKGKKKKKKGSEKKEKEKKVRGEEKAKKREKSPFEERLVSCSIFHGDFTPMSNSYHYEIQRKGRRQKLDKMFGRGEFVDTFIVDQGLKNEDGSRKLNIIEVRDNGRFVVYDYKSAKVVTEFVASGARIKTLYDFAGEEPPRETIRVASRNHKKYNESSKSNYNRARENRKRDVAK